MDFGLPNFFGFAYSPDQLKLLSLIKESNKRNGKKLVLMSAPAFVVDFDYKPFVPLMKALGFDKVTELTFGAKITNQQYHKYIKSNKSAQEKFISSVCPASVELIKNQFPEMKKYLLPFDSPMGAMSKIVKKSYPKHKIIFLAPCNAKKIEASKYLDKKGKRLIELVLTFSEMKQILAKEKVIPAQVSHGFDSFFNDYTKIYPLAGGLCGTMNTAGILEKNEMISCDGYESIKRAFRKKNSKKIFFDLLFCTGGCIGGPGVATKLPIFLRKQRVLNYTKIAAKESMKGKQGITKYTKGISFSREL
ncbi:MAG: [Fe-Fe] hydrogenase large subunit C-terminal domain-containing protein [archaeon]|jgi:iron only hydrogenase large subunit-like protein